MLYFYWITIRINIIEEPERPIYIGSATSTKVCFDLTENKEKVVGYFGSTTEADLR